MRGVQVMAQGLAGFTRRPESLLRQSMPPRDPVATEVSTPHLINEYETDAALGGAPAATVARDELPTQQDAALTELL